MLNNRKEKFQSVHYTNELDTYCPPCNINLCIDCFPLFHKCPNLVDTKKSYLKSHFEKSGAGLDYGEEAAKKRGSERPQPAKKRKR